VARMGMQRGWGGEEVLCGEVGWVWSDADHPLPSEAGDKSSLEEPLPPRRRCGFGCWRLRCKPLDCVADWQRGNAIAVRIQTKREVFMRNAAWGLICGRELRRERNCDRTR
jgi:hypothetical protein